MRAILNLLSAFASVRDGTIISYGLQGGWKTTVTAEVYDKLLRQLSGKQVAIGTSRDQPPSGSVGEWLKKNVNQTALMSYIGPIIIAERYASKVKRGWIQFKSFT